MKQLTNCHLRYRGRPFGAAGLLLWFCLAVLMIFACSSLAEESTVLPTEQETQITILASGTEGSISWQLDQEGVLHIAGTGPMPQLSSKEDQPWSAWRESIQSIVIEQGITTVGSRSFLGCTALTEVQLPSGLTTLQSCAFQYCSALKVISLPESVNRIHSYCFFGCSALEVLALPQGITVLPRSLFYECSSLKELTLPSTLQRVQEFAFYQCEALAMVYWQGTLESWLRLDRAEDYGCPNAAAETLYIAGELITEALVPQDITVLPAFAFRGCKNLSSVSLPESLSVIEIGAFENCSALTGLTLPEGLTVIRDRAFMGCTGLTSLTLPAVLTTIGESAFMNCTGITMIHIPASVRTIDNYAFAYDTGLLNLSFEEGVEIIGKFAFRGCSNLTAVILPDSLVSKGIGVFAECTALTNLTLPFLGRTDGESGTWYSVFGYSFGTEAGDGLAAVRQSFTATSSSTSAWTYYIPSGLSAVTVTRQTALPYGAFYNCTMLKSVTLPPQLISLGSRAFYGCTGISAIFIPATVSTLGSLCFYNCSALTGFEVAEGNTLLKSVDGVLFDVNGNNLIQYPASRPDTAYTVPEGTMVISAYAFYGIKYLREVSLPQTVTTLSSYAFYNVLSSGLKVTLSEGITVLGSSIFSSRAVVWCPYLGITGLTLGNAGISYYPLESDGSYKVLQTEDGAVMLPTGSGPDVLVIPQGITAFEDTQARQIVFLPSSIDENSNFTLTAQSVILPENALSAGNLSLSGTQALVLSQSMTGLSGIELKACTPTVYCAGESAAAAWAEETGLSVCPVTEISRVNNVLLLYVGDILTCSTGETYMLPAESFVLFAAGDISLTLTCPDEAVVISGLSVTSSVAGIYLLTVSAGECQLSLTFSVVDELTSAALVDVLRLPTGLAVIAQESFAGCGAACVIVPEGVLTIQSRAFRDCAVRIIYLPASMTSIANDAFEGCTGLVIFAPQGSVAQAYCKEKKISFISIP